MDPQQAEREITTKRDQLFKVMDSLIEAATEEQSEHIAPRTSATFQSKFNELRELEEEDKASKPIVDAVREVEAMIEAVIPEIDSNLPGMLARRKKKFEKDFERLLGAIKRNRRV